MKPVVQKYGGTSVGNVERVRAVAHRVAKTYKEGQNKLAVVVSAQAGETNRLLSLLHDVSPSPPELAYDMALASGEQVSIALLTAALSDLGVKAVPLLGYQLGVKTSGLHTKARIESISTKVLEDIWQADAVAVVAGFQGVNELQEITTLGRGGSDTSAVALAVAVDAAYCEINTDVTGVFSADPRTVADARIIPELDYEVALEMASLGSKVLHPRCVELGKKYEMPIRVRSSFEEDQSKGTTIMNFDQTKSLEAPVVSAVTLDKNVSRVTLFGLGLQNDIFEKVFSLISEREINVDIIVYDRRESSGELGFSIQSEDEKKVEQTLEELKTNLYKDLKWSFESGLAKVSVVGVGMRSHFGVAAQAFAALADENIPIAMVSTSEIKISCVVPFRMSEKAMQALHQRFFA